MNKVKKFYFKKDYKDYLILIRKYDCIVKWFLYYLSFKSVNNYKLKFLNKKGGFWLESEHDLESFNKKYLHKDLNKKGV